MKKVFGSFLLFAITALIFTHTSRAGSLMGPVQIENFFVQNGQLFANGNIMVPGGGAVPFTAPAAVGNRVTSNSCVILSLVLGPVDLNLLGLAVHLDRVELLVTAMPGPGNLLGNLLCSSKKRTDLLGNLASSLNQVFSTSETTANALPVRSSFGDFAGTIDYETLGTQLTDAQVTPGTNDCPILHLRIEELDLFLLGLRVQTLAPVVLDIVAIPGPGNLLGNLFCQLAHLLDSGSVTNLPLATSTLTSILSELTGGILGTFPGGILSGQGSGGGVLGGQTVESCTILSLVLGPVDLDLLGLQVHLDKVILVVTAEPGPGNLLGNLLCPAKQNKRNTTLRQLKHGLALVSSQPSSSAVDLMAGDSVALAHILPPGDTNACPILHLEIQELNLFLLGLRIESRAPIVLDVTAVPGPGRLLGNLLCAVAHLLDP